MDPLIGASIQMTKGSFAGMYGKIMRQISGDDYAVALDTGEEIVTRIAAPPTAAALEESVAAAAAAAARCAEDAIGVLTQFGESAEAESAPPSPPCAASPRVMRALTLLPDSLQRGPHVDPGIRIEHISPSGRRAWSPDEDRKLTEIMSVIGHRRGDWTTVQWMLGSGRSGKQCRERWMNQLDPTINRAPFSPEEDAVLMREYAIFGSRWVMIGRSMDRRTDQQIKNRFSSLTKGHRYREKQDRHKYKRASPPLLPPPPPPERPSRALDVALIAEIEATLSCAICESIFVDASSLPCGHNFCNACITSAFEQATHACPTCTTPATMKSIRPATNLRAVVAVFDANRGHIFEPRPYRAFLPPLAQGAS